MIPDTVWFYGGMVLTAVSLLLLVGNSIRLHLTATNLEKALEKEYGKRLK